MKGGKLIKNTILIVVSLGVLLILLLYMSGAFQSKIEPDTIETARESVGDKPTDVVQEIVDTEQVEVVGTLRAERRTEVAPKIMATIEQVNIRAGERVEKGRVLVRLDDRDYQARLEQANQAVVGAQASLRNAKTEYERQKSLLESNAGTQQALDQAEAQYQVSEAEMKRAQEAVKAAQTTLSYTVIEAPINGIVVDKLVDVGDTASPGRPLMTIYDPEAFRLEAAVPEALSSDISVGRKLTVRLDTLNMAVEGEVAEVVPQAETASRSFLVKVDIPEDPRMVEGMFGRLLIPTRKRTRFCVADSAVRSVGQLRFVDVVTESGELERRQITIGAHSEMGRVEVLSGLDAGESVVLHGPPPPPMPTPANDSTGGEVQ